MKEDDGLKKIYESYNKLTYIDQYSGSILQLVIIMLILFLIVSYCQVMINVKPIQDNWPQERCKLKIMPFAGLINAPEGTSSNDYTSQNFSYCIQNILSTFAGYATEPITFATNMLQNLINEIKKSINSARAMFDKVRTEFQKVTGEIMGRIMNMMIPIQTMIIAMKDFFSKMQGTMAAGLYTVLGSFYTLQSLFGAIAEFIIIILVALAAIIIVLWVIPVTWGAAASMTAVFLSIAIPMSIILAFMIEYLKVKPSIGLPTVKCFDENTKIKVIENSNVIEKSIENIELGDVLYPNNRVTAKMKLLTHGSEMYNLKGIIVSDSHLVKHKDKWILVSHHPDAIKIASYNKKYLYCLNTTNKTIVINDYEFTDWDEITDLSELFCELNNGITSSSYNTVNYTNNKCKNIKDVCPGDILEDNNIVYGVVEIESHNIPLFEYNINNRLISGSNNLCSPHIDKKLLDNLDKTKIKINNNKLYHLLTSSGLFRINNFTVYDYNYWIDNYMSFKKYNL